MLSTISNVSSIRESASTFPGCLIHIGLTFVSIFVSRQRYQIWMTKTRLALIERRSMRLCPDYESLDEKVRRPKKADKSALRLETDVQLATNHFVPHILDKNVYCHFKVATMVQKSYFRSHIASFRQAQLYARVLPSHFMPAQITKKVLGVLTINMLNQSGCGENG